MSENISFPCCQAIALTNCTISVEAAQLVRAREANYPPVGPGEKVGFKLIIIIVVIIIIIQEDGEKCTI